MIKPMLATPYEDHLVGFPCYMQPKLDGVRAIYHDGHFYTRNGERWRDAVVEHILKALFQTALKDTTLDGEFYRHNWKFQRINSAIGVNRFEPSPETPQIQYWIFDRIQYNVPFSQRIIPIFIQEPLHIVATIKAVTRDNGEEAFSMWCDHGFEGAIYRTNDCMYLNERSKHLVKRKQYFEEEFKVVGVERGKITSPLGGRNQNRCGSLVCGTAGGETFKVGSGLSDEQRDLFWKTPEVIVGGMVKVRFDSWSTGGKPLKPRMIALC